MCDILGPVMDNYRGDLSDIIRACGASYNTLSAEAVAPFSRDHWQFSSDPMIFSSDPSGNFGDPFSNMRDPFLHELHNLSDSTYFNSSGALEEATCFGGGVATSSNSYVFGQKILEGDMKKPCNNILSQTIEISLNDELPVLPVVDSLSRALKPSGVMDLGNNMIDVETSKEHCLVGNTEVQISSSRNPGLKRRKSQSKKSICVPAPAAPNSRQSGEVVPSDLWAWRKYGQKPIKGSPYPRGYYRCSSSKGCPARKQVERSKSDPNMLVITYTSEHNHPWPTHRNSLTGSTKNNKKNSETTPQNEEEQYQESNSDSNNVNNSASLKEEEEKQLESMNDGEFSDIGLSYEPISNKGLFGEIEKAHSSLNLLSPPHGFDHDQKREFNALDSFHFFDWSG